MEIKIIIDLRDQFGEIRDQGQRPTCMAFAASDTHSFARRSREPLSVEYAFYYAVQRMIIPDRTQAVSFDLISQALSIDGQPSEVSWPYVSNLLTTDEWKPPKISGIIFKRNSEGSLTNLESIYTSLDDNQPLILIIKISRSFFYATKEILLRKDKEPTINTHTIIAVGYGESRGTRCLLIRNSWGNQWGMDGYAWIDEDYLRPRLLFEGKMV